ncbi:DUF443 family protein [Enterococcus ureilyticus]|uniref:DUF443 family protein n=1 Tax=Enterococcus ureilyticus TaxID=1131292 RepID=UPI001A918DEB|nr:DUF443 family protein [Enterococcus ureilyticus]MBO0445692.1 DUF443 family protein [Enterococcus ureilyticus]
MNVIVKTENKRYKQLTYNGQKILLDMDSNKLTWLFPFLVWFFPVKGYINEELPIFKESNSKGKSSGAIVLSSSILASVLIRMTNKGFGDLRGFSNPQLVAGTLLFCSTVIVILIRYFYRYRKNHVLISNEKVVLIRFKFMDGFKSKYNYIGKVLLVVIFCYAVVIYFSITFVTSYLNIILIPVICMVEYLISIANTTIEPPETDVELLIENKDE